MNQRSWIYSQECQNCEYLLHIFGLIDEVKEGGAVLFV